MFKKNIIVAYPILLIVSIGKSFEALGELIGKTGKTVCRWMFPASYYYEEMSELSKQEFANEKKLYLTFDDTLIRKIYSQLMEGSSKFYDTKLFRRITGYKLIVAMISNGSKSLPLYAKFLFSGELIPDPKETKFEWIQKIISLVQEMFPNAEIIVIADGAFATKQFLRWCVDDNISTEVRMRSNCSVTYKGERILIRDIKDLMPTGRQMARTIEVLWHGIPLHMTAQKRVDKNEDVTIVFQASTFKTKPSNHVRIYRLRWDIEKMFRTTKQHLGLQDCLSRKIEVQESHVAAVFLAYALLQCDRIEQGLPTPEAAIRAAKLKKGKFLERYIKRLCRIIQRIYV